MEPAVGIEPTTGGLRNRCSTAELRWRADVRVLIQPPVAPAAPLKHMAARVLGRQPICIIFPRGLQGHEVAKAQVTPATPLVTAPAPGSRACQRRLDSVG